MKWTAIWLLVLVITFVLLRTTLEGVENPKLVNISENPYSISFIRPVTYNYKYNFAPIIVGTNSQTSFLPSTDLSKVYLHVAIIVPENATEAQINTLKTRIQSTSFKEAIKTTTIIKSAKDFSKFITTMNITDANIIMKVYDLLEVASKKELPTIATVLQYKEIPANAAQGELFIQRAINIPFIDTKL